MKRRQDNRDPSLLLRCQSILIFTLQVALAQPFAWWSAPVFAQCGPTELNSPNSVDGGESTVAGMPGLAPPAAADAIGNQGKTPEVPDTPPDLGIGYIDPSRDDEAYSGLSASGGPGGDDSHGGAKPDSKFNSFSTSVASGWDGSSMIAGSLSGTSVSPSGLFSYGFSQGGKSFTDEYMLAVLDPIDVSRANKPHIQVDYVSGGAAPLRLTRTYHSNLAAYGARVGDVPGRGVSPTTA